MNRILYLLALCSFNVSAQSREISIHSTTAIGPNSRYEIVQSTLAARWTFRLDKVCGNISQLVLNKDEELVWQAMPILGQPRCTADGKIRYQIFTSGLAARHTFLINTDLGKTWQLQGVKDKDGNEFSAWVGLEN
jgi:hypothetical protein